MSTEEYQHKFAVVSPKGKTDLADFEHIEEIVKKSGFGGRHLVQLSKLPGYIGFVLEMDKLPTRTEWKRLGILEPKEINY